MEMWKFFSCVLLCILQPNTLFAELVWSSTNIEHQASYEDEKYIARYTFKKKGDDTEVISEIVTSCGCLAPKLAKKEFSKGETGEILVTFNFGDFVGLQKKTIVVKTNMKTYKLLLRVTIPEVFALSPGTLKWKIGSQPTTQSISLTSKLKTPVKILYVKSEDSNFKTELIQKDSGSNYVIRVTPIETELDMATVIWIKTDFLLGNRNKYIRGYAKIVN